MSLPSQMNIGCGTDIRNHWCNVDLKQLPGMQINRDYWGFDIGGPFEKFPTPITATRFKHFEASHIIEHLPNTLRFMENLWKLAEPGATLRIRCPHGGSDTAWQDQTHVRAMFEGSFQYFDQRTYWMQDTGYKGDWETEHVNLYTKGLDLTDKDQAYRMIQHGRNWVEEMEALLVAVKPKRERPDSPQQVPLVIGLY
jgi:predicted SAM-dependent methyltransferase